MDKMLGIPLSRISHEQHAEQLAGLARACTALQMDINAPYQLRLFEIMSMVNRRKAPS
jgi:hypothetical protein